MQYLTQNHPLGSKVHGLGSLFPKLIINLYRLYRISFHSAMRSGCNFGLMFTSTIGWPFIKTSGVSSSGFESRRPSLKAMGRLLHKANI